MMSFLGEIQNFNKSKLKSSSTLITTADGTQYLETKDEHGRLRKSLIAAGVTLGYLADLKPDLQVAIIIPGLFLGSQDVAADFELLKKHCVTHILNVASLVDNIFPEEFTYKRIDMLDVPHFNIVRYFPECFAFIDEALAKQGCILVHCNAGVSRSSTIVIGYLMKKNGMTFQEAFDHVKKIRHVIRPNAGFMKQLKEYKP